MGIFPGPTLPLSAVNVGIARAGGGVKVDCRVGMAVTINWAARVGSIVEVCIGVGVGGGSTIGRFPGVTSTKGAYTQAMLPGTPS